MFKKEGKKNKIKIFIPSPIYCTDNATMIAKVAYYKVLKKKLNSVNKNISIKPSLELTNW